MKNNGSDMQAVTLCGGWPRLISDKGKLRDNITTITRKCHALGINVAGVIKGMNAIPELVELYDDSNCSMIASSRMQQLIDAKECGIKKPLMLVRTPMPSEVECVVRYADYSLNSEIAVLTMLDEAARALGKKHKVILMAEMGDLREGFYGEEALIEAALHVEHDLNDLELAGVGMNVGCYGSILPTRAKLDEFVALAEKVELVIGHELEIISGGATSSLLRVFDGDMPDRINQLRIGEGILLAHDLEEFYGADMSDMNKDVFTLEAEIIEVKEKPTHPVGEIGRDAFGRVQEYEDRGIRKRAIAAVGKLDYGDEHEIMPLAVGSGDDTWQDAAQSVSVIGASSDHTILDVEDLDYDIKIGDKIRFGITYASLVFVTQSKSMTHLFIGE